MCARYSLVIDDQAFLNLFDLPVNTEAINREDIFPTNLVPVIGTDSSGKHFYSDLKWGFIAAWATDRKKGFINARSETAAERPTFRDAFRHRRCLLPASSFFEWHKGEKMRLSLPEENYFFMAGLWERTPTGLEPEIDTVTILTTGSNHLISEIHDRMPVIISRENISGWLGPNTDSNSLLALCEPYPSDKTIMSKVPKEAVATQPNLFQDF